MSIPSAVVRIAVAVLFFVASAAEASQCVMKTRLSAKRVAKGERVQIGIWPQDPPPEATTMRISPLNPFEGLYPKGLRGETMLEKTRDQNFMAEFDVEVTDEAPPGPVDVLFAVNFFGPDGQPIPTNTGVKFTLEVAGAGDVEVYVGTTTNTDARDVSVPAGGTTPIKLIAMPKDGYAGPVRVTYTTSSPTLSLMQNGQRVDELSFEVGGGRPTMQRVDVAAAPDSPSGQVILNVSGTGVEKQKTFAVNVVSAPAPVAVPPSFKVQLPPSVELTAGEGATVPFILEGTNGWNGKVDVKIAPLPGITIDPLQFSLQTGETTSISVVVAPDAQPLPPGQDRLYISADAYDNGQLTNKQIVVAVKIKTAAAPAPPAALTGWRVTFSPAEVPVLPGEWQDINVTIERPAEGGGFVNLQPRQGQDLFGTTWQQGPTISFGPGETTGKMRVSAEPHFTDATRAIEFELAMLGGPAEIPIEGTTARLVFKRAASSLVATISPENVSLWPGESRSFEVAVRDIKGAYKLQLHAASDRDDVKVAVLSGNEMNAPGGSSEIGVVVAPDARAGRRTIMLQYRDPLAGPNVIVKEVPLVFDVRRRDAKLDVSPQNFELQPGEARRVSVSVTGKDGYAGPVTVSVEDAGEFTVEPRTVRIDHLPGAAEMTVQAPAVPGAKSARIRLQVRHEGVDSVMHSETIFPSVRAPEAQFSATAIPGKLQIQSASWEKFTVVVDRENGWDGPVDFEIGGSNRVQVEPSRGRIEAGQKTAEIKVTAPAGTQASGGYEPSLMIKVVPVGGGNAREASVGLNITAVPVEAPPPPEPAAPAFSLMPSTGSIVIHKRGEQAQVNLTARGEGGWNGVVRVQVHRHDRLGVDRESFELNTADPAASTRTLTFKPLEMGGGGYVEEVGHTVNPIVIEATTAGGEANQTVTIMVNSQGSPYQPPPPPPPLPEPVWFDPEPMPAPKPAPAPAAHLVVTLDTTPGLRAIVDRVAAEAVAMEGIADSVPTTQHLFESPQDAELVIGYGRVHESLLAALRSAQLVVADGRGAQPQSDEISEEVVAQMLREISARSVAPRAHGQLASLTLPILASRYQDPEVTELMRDLKAGRANWQEMTRQLEPVELLVMQLRASRQSRNIATWTSIADETVAEMNERINEMKVANVPLPRLQQVIAGLAVTSSITAVLNTVMKVDVALMPSHISDFYSVVKGQTRRHGDPAPEIAVGECTKFEVFAIAESDGGDFVKPVDIVARIAGGVWGAIALRGPKPGKPGRGRDEEVTPDPQEEVMFYTKMQFQEHVYEKVTTILLGIPFVRDWVAKANAPLTIKKVKTKAFLLNSDRLLTLRVGCQGMGPCTGDEDAYSNRLIRFEERGKGRYCLAGLHPTDPGKEAGYYFSLKRWLVAEFSESGGRSPNAKGVVTVTRPMLGPACKVGDPCPRGDEIHFPLPGGWTGKFDASCNCVPDPAKNNRGRY